MKLIYLKSTLKCDSFDVAIGIKIPFFRVLVTTEPGRSLLQFVTTNCLMMLLLPFNKTCFLFKIISFMLWSNLRFDHSMLFYQTKIFDASVGLSKVLDE